MAVLIGCDCGGCYVGEVVFTVMAPRAKRAAKVDGDSSAVLTERVNVDLLHQVAQSRLGCWRPQAGGPRLRTILA